MANKFRTSLHLTIGSVVNPVENDSFSNEKSDNQNGHVSATNLQAESTSSIDSITSPILDEAIDFDKYGSTPPRTRISRRLRERKQKDRENSNSPKTHKRYGCPFSRRNTVETFSNNESPQEITSPTTEPDFQSRRAEKRSLKLLRGSERDLKLDIGQPAVLAMKLDRNDDRCNSMPAVSHPPIGMPTLIETCNRFMSLTSRPVTCRLKKNLECFQKSHSSDLSKTDSEEWPDDRVDFFKKVNKMIRIGSADNKLQRQESQDQIWQNELQDLIWLELQAYHADRTATEQDCYLCQERKKVRQLLQDIMNYRFKRNRDKKSGIFRTQTSTSTTCSNDSGYDPRVSGSDPASITSERSNDCPGCLSMYCESCMEDQQIALQEVDYLLNKLDAAASLYPSSRSFALQYPLYKSPEFTSKVKVMCLWYNLMKHQRFKLYSMGKFIVSLHGRYKWPINVQEDSSSTSGVHTEHSSDETGLSHPDSGLSQNVSVENQPQPVTPPCRTPAIVKFDIESSSPSESNNSTASSAVDSSVGSTEEDFVAERPVEYLSIIPVEILDKNINIIQQEAETSPYRTFIEDVLKTKGLTKSLLFLETLHQSVLQKAQITLEKPPKGMSFEEYCDSYCSIEKHCDDEEKSAHDIDECELRRYGYWSPEAQELQLPSYRAVFIFLSLVPIRVVHEFMRMKLEQKPTKPSPLCIGQLMKELKEGLHLAVVHRQRLLRHITTVIEPEDIEWDYYQTIVSKFDESVKGVFEIYMDYLEQWSLMIQHESFQKTIIEDEWCFIKTIYPQIPGIKVLIGQKLCSIVGSMLNGIVRTLTTRVEELEASIHKGIAADDDSENRHCMWFVCRKLQRIINEEREQSLKTLAFTKTLRKELRADEFASDSDIRTKVDEALTELRSNIIGLRKMLNQLIERLQQICDIPSTSEDLDETERANLHSKCCDILHQAFKFGFEIYMQHHVDIAQFKKEMHALDLKMQNCQDRARNHISRSIIHFAKLWMQFVLKRCERGRGQRPRWAMHGLEFLTIVCEPQYTKHLSNTEFEEFKAEVDACLNHIVGTATPSPDTNKVGTFGRPKAPSPQHSMIGTSFMKSRNSLTKLVKDNVDKFLSPEGSDTPDFSSKMSPPSFDKKTYLTVPSSRNFKSLRADRIRDSINKLEIQLDEKLRANDLIGQVTATHSVDRVYIKSRVVTFSWQRGIKIGQGRFGKVYTAVNNETGEMLAMKEISLQPNDHKMIKRVAEEIKTFEGITHENLVRYYGVEIHREEMLIFMEFCPEGTLENLVAATEGGLPEPLIRQYTRQLLSAVATLHGHSIVHRDIKSANIFLTNEGNCLKLGDFGSAVKIKAHTTMPGELQGFVGTQAYMAPEVFMKTNTEGHGRAADIWSLGCVVVEMGTGKRPWSQYDSNYQIMFVVGMGETPEVPERLSDEGKDFLDRCLQHDPKNRNTAVQLQQHNFVKVDEIYLK